MLVISFIFFLLVFALIGTASFFFRKKTTEDYLVAGRSLPAWLVGLSAVATNNSGFMFAGMIGYTYMTGLSSIWILFAWMAGDFFSSLFVHRRLRIASASAVTYAEALSGWNNQNHVWVRRLCAGLTFVFLGTYAAAQFSAGGKALYVLFGWDLHTGAIVGAVIVLLYCFAGGIRASIWTDAAQSFVMLASMAMMAVVAVHSYGGWTLSTDALKKVSSTYLDLFPADPKIGAFAGALAFVGGWVLAGIGVVGQPHIMIRFMAMKSPDDIRMTRFYYYGWYSIFCVFVLLTGLLARLMLPGLSEGDAELAMPRLALELLPGIWAGLALAGLFAATMSTADSQILSCSASLTNDLGIGRGSYIGAKIATLAVTLSALLIALFGSESVFSLVLIAWSGLGSAFAPLLLLYAFGRKLSEPAALAVIISGFFGMLFWRLFGSPVIYEIAPGFVAGFLAYGVSLIVPSGRVRSGESVNDS